MHANLRRQHVLSFLGANANRTLDINAAPQQPRLPMHLVTSKRAIAAAHAKIHVHHQKIHAVDDARGDLFFGGS